MGIRNSSPYASAKPGCLRPTATVYGARGITRVLKTTALSVGVVVIVLGYRFVLLLITLYTT